MEEVVAEVVVMEAAVVEVTVVVAVEGDMDEVVEEVVMVEAAAVKGVITVMVVVVEVMVAVVIAEMGQVLLRWCCRCWCIADLALQRLVARWWRREKKMVAPR